MLKKIKPFRKTLMEQSETDRSSNAVFSCVTLSKDGELGHVRPYQGPCHGGLQRENNYVPSDTRLVLSAVRSCYQRDTELLVKFLEWLINSSPWASVFLDKDAKSVLDNGLVVDARAPQDLVGNAMMASRFLTENYDSQHSHRWPLYKGMLEQGFDMTEAFLWAHFFRPANFKKGVFPLNFSPLASGHSCLRYGDYGETYFKNFLTSNVATKTRAFADGSKGGYEAGTPGGVWGTDQARSNLLDWCRTVAPKKKLSLLKDLHIFRPKPIDGVSVTDWEDFKSVTDQIKERIYAI